MQRDPQALKITDNYYFNAIHEAYLSQTNPTPYSILLVLFKLYVNDAAKKYLGFIPGARHSHTAKVAQCAGILEKNASYRGMSDALKELCTVQNINPYGALEKLLGAYFSLYPQYISLLSNQPLLAAAEQHQSTELWKKPTDNAVLRFIDMHRDTPDFIHHELLEKLSDVINPEFADIYADYLLSQLHQKRSEARTNLYNGWVAASLGALATKLSLSKRKQVTEKLIGFLDTDKASLATIGLCDALVALVIDKDILAHVGAHLHRYMQRAMPEMIELFDDHQTAIISQYMPKIFHALVALKDYLTPEMKADIAEILIKPTHIYPLRHGIDALRGWFSGAQNNTLRKEITAHNEFLNLAVALNERVYTEDFKSIDHQFKQRLAECLSSAKKSLLSDATHIAYLVPRMKLLLTDATQSETTKAEILAALANKLNKCSDSNITKESYIALHQTLALSQSWCHQAGKITIATLLITALKRHKTLDETTLTVASAAAELAGHLKILDMYYVRDTLLALLETKYQDEAAKGLQSFAKGAPNEQLPDLMTRLLISKQPIATLLLAETERLYVSQKQELKNTNKPVI